MGSQVREKLVSRVHQSGIGRTEITCIVEGYPPPSVYWYKDGQIIDTTSGTSLIMEGDVETELLGIYQCFAENTAGYTVMTTRVLLDGTDS